MMSYRVPRMRSAGTESSCSFSSSGSLNSPKDFHEVKELVKDVSRRLDILEKVFVFVDIEQINQVIASFSTQSCPNGKAGTDDISLKLDASPQVTPRDADCVETSKACVSVSDGVCDLKTACGDWQSVPDGRAAAGSGIDGIRDLKTAYGDWQSVPDGRAAAGTGLQPRRSSQQHNVAFQASKSPYPLLQAARGRLQPLEPPKSMHSTAFLLQPSKLRPPKASLLQDATEKNGLGADDAEKNPGSTGSTTAFASTCSTTAFASTCSTPAFAASTCDDEEDIEPERCNYFMKQALQSAKAKQTWIDKVSRMREKPTMDPSRQSDPPR